MMESVNVTEFSQHLLDYLIRVEQGHEIGIMVQGKTVARLIPYFDNNKRDAATRRLEKLRGTMIVGDVLTPIATEWSGDADNL